MTEEIECQHQCDRIPANGIAIMKAEYDDSVWVIRAYREATEEDLQENHYLENIGDWIEHSDIEIDHCPYCGHRLSKDTEVKQRDQVIFRHWDDASW